MQQVLIYQNLLKNLKLNQKVINKILMNLVGNTTVDLSKLSDVVKNEVVKKTVYDKLVKNVNVIHSSDY